MFDWPVTTRQAQYGTAFHSATTRADFLGQGVCLELYMSMLAASKLMPPNGPHTSVAACCAVPGAERRSWLRRSWSWQSCTKRCSRSTTGRLPAGPADARAPYSLAVDPRYRVTKQMDKCHGVLLPFPLPAPWTWTTWIVTSGSLASVSAAWSDLLKPFTGASINVTSHAVLMLGPKRMLYIQDIPP